MAEDREGLLRHYRTMRQDLLSASENLDDELMTEPSLDGWSVKNHLVHLAFWDDIRASEVVRISAGHDPAWRVAGGRDDALNALASDMRRNLSLEQGRWELETSRQRLIDAITSANPRGLEPDLYGEVALRSMHEAQHTGRIKRWRDEKGIERNGDGIGQPPS